MDNKYEIEPIMADSLLENIKKYNEHTYSIFEDEIKELAQLIEKYGMFICTDKSQDFSLNQQEFDRLIELSIKLNLTLAAMPITYESEYNYMKKYWYPNWEICNGCPKRFTYRCKKENCNPLDI